MKEISEKKNAIKRAIAYLYLELPESTANDVVADKLDDYIDVVEKNMEVKEGKK